MTTGRTGTRSRRQRAGDFLLGSVPSSRRRLRAAGNLGLALVAGLAGVSLLAGDLDGTDVEAAGSIFLTLGAIALTAGIRGFRTPAR